MLEGEFLQLEQKEINVYGLVVNDETDLTRATHEDEGNMRRERGTRSRTINASANHARDGGREGSNGAHLAHLIPLRPTCTCSTLIGESATNLGSIEASGRVLT